jgi:hypothetical protein
VTPRLVIVVALERVPIAVIDAEHSGDELRLLAWLEAHPDYADIVSLAYLSALELMREARRAA